MGLAAAVGFIGWSIGFRSATVGRRRPTDRWQARCQPIGYTEACSAVRACVSAPAAVCCQGLYESGGQQCRVNAADTEALHFFVSGSCTLSPLRIVQPILCTVHYKIATDGMQHALPHATHVGVRL